MKNEKINKFVCGSDTIFCIDEFGFDDGYFGNYKSMKNGYTFSFAASFGDAHFYNDDFDLLLDRLNNFKRIGLRENTLIDCLKEKISVPIERVIDPTLLLEAKDYNELLASKQCKKKYLLLYARRYNKKMEDFAEKIAKKNGWEIIEISLRATNADKHIMRYDAGVEEFLSLVKNAEYVVTNSFHGGIFSIQFKKQFVIFSREQCDTKILQLLTKLGCPDRLIVNGDEKMKELDYDFIFKNINDFRESSLQFLSESCEEAIKWKDI